MQNLNKFLQGIDDIEFRQLELRLQIGRLLRNTEMEHELSMAEMTRRLELDPLEYLKWRKGAKDFSVEQMAKINVVIDELIRKRTFEKDMIKIKLDEKKVKKK